MCIPLIEAPVAIPEAILKHLDPYMGSDMGRIYRVVPTGLSSRRRFNWQL